MNERLVFPLSVSVAEFGASAIFFLLVRESPLLRRYPDLLAYLGAHAVPSVCAWILLTALSAMLMPRLWRRRQNRSSKLSLLVRIGLLGLVIDLLGSVYLWIRGEEEGLPDLGSPVVSFVVRLAVYAVVFALVVGIADQISAWHERRNPPSATPPPRFGRV